MKNIFTSLILFISFSAFAQTTMTVHTSSGSTDFLLSEIDSITYGNGGSSGGGYTVGGNGPAGGIIFYDKGSYSNGWRYLEASINDLNDSEWGCYGISISGTSDAVGSGEANTNTIVSQCTTPGIAAKVCYNYSITNNGVNYDDWFLPSIEELSLLYNAINNNTVVDVFHYISAYWSSTEYSQYRAWEIRPSDGSIDYDVKNTSNHVKVIRRF